MIGFFVNFVAGLIQLASGAGQINSDLLPFTISAGLFANENHFSTLIFMMIPLIAWFHLARNRRPAIYLLFVLLIVSFLFAIGSRAGMALSLALALLCSLWFMAPRAAFALKLAILLVAVAALGVSLRVFGLPGTIEGDLRSVFFATTLDAILDHLPLGTGLGTFTSIYPGYEPREAIIDVYANHAHNDYLEIMLETGMFGVTLVLFFFALILRHAGRTPLTQAAFIAVAAVALHSIVDYPLRTFAVATPFTLFAVLILSTVPDRRRSVRLPAESQPDFVAHRQGEPIFADSPEAILPDRVEYTRKS
jgi:O-antigen ligase